MKIDVTRCPQSGSGIPLKLGLAPKRTGSLFACPLLAQSGHCQVLNDVRFWGKADIAGGAVN